MKPLPIQPDVLRSRPANAVRSSRRRLSPYPVLLILSTLLAGVFCVLYLTKPVLRVGAEGTPLESSSGQTPAVHSLPALPQTLPGDTPESNGPQPTSPADLAVSGSPDTANPYEETNLKIQHVLSVTSADGELGRIVTDVPVLYQSRNLRWNAVQVIEARRLLDQLRAHQQQSRALRAEGMMLLDSWHQLLARSIPATVLRADSPTLPTNQAGESGGSAPAGLETSESIQVRTADNR